MKKSDLIRLIKSSIILHLGVVLAVCFSLIDDASLGEFIELFGELFIDGIKFLPFSFIVIIVSFFISKYEDYLIFKEPGKNYILINKKLREKNLKKNK
ncbi:hypothetical protein GVX76_05460 [[Haemophilus] felis]|nr:hypothetical protein [[Haemophilus] felis]